MEALVLRATMLQWTALFGSMAAMTTCLFLVQNQRTTIMMIVSRISLHEVHSITVVMLLYIVIMINGRAMLWSVVLVLVILMDAVNMLIKLRLKPGYILRN